MLSRGLGNINYFTEPEAKALLDLKQKWGYKDPRIDAKNCDICANDVFRNSWKETGVAPKAFTPPNFLNANAPAVENAPLDQETLVQAITDKVMAMLAGKN
jgi:L-fuculose-phosphate aldolase